jgi:hypothetical protein
VLDTFVFIVFLVVLVWYLADSLAAREAGVLAAKEACEKEGLLFLDDTVAQRGIRVMRKDNGHLAIQRSFEFEYSDTGNNRRPGNVTLLGRVVIMIYTGPHAVDLQIPSDHD